MNEQEYMNFVLLQSIETNEEEELIRLGLLTEKTTKPILLIDSNIPMASTSKLESNSSNKNITGNRKVWPKSNLIEKIKFDINTGLNLLEVQLLENVNPGYCCISDLGKPSEWGMTQSISGSHDDISTSTSSKGKGRERIEVIPIPIKYQDGAIRITRTPGRIDNPNTISIEELLKPESMLGCYLQFFHFSPNLIYPCLPIGKHPHSIRDVPCYISRDIKLDRNAPIAVIYHNNKEKLSNPSSTTFVKFEITHTDDHRIISSVLQKRTREVYGKNYNAIYPPKKGGLIHSKFILTIYQGLEGEKFLRLIITTANGSEQDMIDWDNLWYIQDFPQLTSHPRPKEYKPTQFESLLFNHLESLNCPDEFIDSIRGKFDFSAANDFYLVTSESGTFRSPTEPMLVDGSKAKKTKLEESKNQKSKKQGKEVEIAFEKPFFEQGLFRLQTISNEILNRHQHGHSPDRVCSSLSQSPNHQYDDEEELRYHQIMIESCSASVGKIDEDWLEGFYRMASGKSIDSEEQCNVEDGFSIVFPCARDVLATGFTPEETTNGGHAFKWDLSTPAVQSLFKHYESTDPIPTLTHQKLLLRKRKEFSDDPTSLPLWLYLGSHNLSAAAWGSFLPATSTSNSDPTTSTSTSISTTEKKKGEKRKSTSNSSTNSSSSCSGKSKGIQLKNTELGIIIPGEHLEKLIGGMEWDEVMTYKRPAKIYDLLGLEGEDRKNDRPYNSSAWKFSADRREGEKEVEWEMRV